MNRWQPPTGTSRTGASHRRRGRPCQDASGWQVFRAAGGESVVAVVVSDGHGAARHDRSDVGSRLACAVALQEVERTLSAGCGGDPRDWEAWLAESLPQRIVAGWRQAVQAEARRGSSAPAVADTEATIPYGATLGLLVLTPWWWGHTGLGDWDLVWSPADGSPELISEEVAPEERGEATASLCLEAAERQFRPRAALELLRPDTPPFALLLSSDGIRKSCGSDSDYLRLADHLIALAAAAGDHGDGALEEALDHISQEGSGDDVSAMVVRWGAEAERPGGEPPWR